MKLKILLFLAFTLPLHILSQNTDYRPNLEFRKELQKEVLKEVLNETPANFKSTISKAFGLDLINSVYKNTAQKHQLYPYDYKTAIAFSKVINKDIISGGQTPATEIKTIYNKVAEDVTSKLKGKTIPDSELQKYSETLVLKTIWNLLLYQNAQQNNNPILLKAVRSRSKEWLSSDLIAMKGNDDKIPLKEKSERKNTEINTSTKKDIYRVYLENRTIMGPTGTTIYYNFYVLLNNGKFYESFENIPSIDNLKLFKNKPKKYGIWKKSGKDISLKFKNGKVETTKNLTLGTPATKGQKLQGKYSRQYGYVSVGGLNKQAGFKVNTITFRKDGSFQRNISVSTFNSRGIAAKSRANNQGTYTLSGYALTLKFENGKIEHHAFCNYTDKMIFIDEGYMLKSN